MLLYGKSRSLSNSLGRAISVTLFLLLGVTPFLRAQKHEDFDQYRLRLDGGWFYSTPSGNIQGHGDTVPVDFQKDLGFNSIRPLCLDWTGSSPGKIISCSASAGSILRIKRSSIGPSPFRARPSRQVCRHKVNWMLCSFLPVTSTILSGANAAILASASTSTCLIPQPRSAPRPRSQGTEPSMTPNRRAGPFGLRFPLQGRNTVCTHQISSLFR